MNAGVDRLGLLRSGRLLRGSLQGFVRLLIGSTSTLDTESIDTGLQSTGVTVNRGNGGRRSGLGSSKVQRDTPGRGGFARGQTDNSIEGEHKKEEEYRALHTGS